MIIKFGDISNSLGTRHLGQKLRGDIERNLSSGLTVTLDFSGVTFVSHSFADECIGKLLNSWDLPKLKEQTTFINANPKVEKAIIYCLNERLAHNALSLT